MQLWPKTTRSLGAFETQRELDDLTQERDNLQGTLTDPQWLDTAGVSENTVLNLISDVDDPAKLREQIDALHKLETQGGTNARLSGVLAEIADGSYRGVDNGKFTEKMQEHCMMQPTHPRLMSSKRF